jgi:hypothetical protein
MAKITAHGASEVARVYARSASGTPYVYVMCSDGRILQRWDHPGSGFREAYDNIPVPKRTEDYLAGIIRRQGWTVENG